MGRPTIFSEELETKILNLISSGDSVNAIFQREDMPNASTFYQWCIDKPSFSDKCALARDHRKAFILDEMVDIADQGAKDADESTTSVQLGYDRLRIEARDKKLARMAPRKEDQKEDANTLLASALAALANKLPE